MCLYYTKTMSNKYLFCTTKFFQIMFCTTNIVLYHQEYLYLDWNILIVVTSRFPQTVCSWSSLCIFLYKIQLIVIYFWNSYRSFLNPPKYLLRNHGFATLISRLQLYNMYLCHVIGKTDFKYCLHSMMFLQNSDPFIMVF